MSLLTTRHIDRTRRPGSDKNILDLGDSPVGCEDEEEKLLKQAIALSLEGETENDKEEENNDEEDAEEDGEDEEEELMLRQAIALSLEDD